MPQRAGSGPVQSASPGSLGLPGPLVSGWASVLGAQGKAEGWVSRAPRPSSWLLAGQAQALKQQRNLPLSPSPNGSS